MPPNQTTGLFERTVDKILDAAFDDTRWGDAFRAMDSLCGLNGGQFTALETDADGAAVATFAACYIHGDPHEEIVRDWAENFAEHSENVPRISRLPAWVLTHNEALFTRSEKRSSVMYNEFQPKYDCRDQVAVVVDRPSGVRRANGCLMWTMANGGPGWEPDKLKRIYGLLPHIRNAVRVRQELVVAEAHACAELPALLEQNSLGILLLDRRGTMVSANQSATRLLRDNEGIHDWKGFLGASLPRDNAMIRKLVARALPRPGNLPVGGYLLIRRPYGLPLIVHVHPITPSRGDFGAERLAVLVLIRDPDARQLDPGMVGDVLGLTAAESRVAALLGQGSSVREIARELNRSENTVRWTLKNVMSKTNSTRQADLVRLLMQLPPGNRDS